ncbi:hypothetical protein CRG98_029603 [Punica granatum]|uniref:Reverse transcriptase zinc-binding domain-containing protein n=1 Tax=Punica granatum TaxID=22663 RepID=A0A2I0J2T9_PUNGR|nr:hypothetical protein CRG98_029603 [Punica granatum]
MYLSKGARLTLRKTSLSYLPTYFMSIFVIPKSVVDRTEKIQRDFLWDSDENRSSFHLVSWSDICQPLSSGVLGSRSLVNFNIALLGKWLWRFANERSSLWRRVISSKFGISEGNWHTELPSFSCGVSLWKPMLKFFPTYEMQVKFNVGESDCSRINFWNDCCCGDQSLRIQFPSLFQISMNKEARVGDIFCLSNGVWSLFFSRNLYGFELQSLSSFFSKIYSDFKRSEGPDNMQWKLMKSGKFSVKSSYDELVDSDVLTRSNYGVPSLSSSFGQFGWRGTKGLLRTLRIRFPFSGAPPMGVGPGRDQGQGQGRGPILGMLAWVPGRPPLEMVLKSNP